MDKQLEARHRGKIFGIGLPRTATTSMAAAMLELGFKTCHACFSDLLLDVGDAFFDTPIYADYPLLDQHYPGSKFIYTWRDPHRWVASFSKNIVPYLYRIQKPDFSPKNNMYRVNLESYSKVFTMQDVFTQASLLQDYENHRRNAETFFRHRPQDVLFLDLDASIDPWEELCSFLGCPHPTTRFPYVGSTGVQAWRGITHRNKIPSHHRIPKYPKANA